MQVVVGEMKDDPEAEAKSDEKPTTKSSANTVVKSLGISVSALSAQVREKFGMDDQSKGLIITDVNGDSVAAEKGLRPGDVIIDAAQQALETPADLIKQVEKAKSAGHQNILLRVENPQSIRYVVLPLETAPKTKK